MCPCYSISSSLSLAISFFRIIHCIWKLVWKIRKEIHKGGLESSDQMRTFQLLWNKKASLFIFRDALNEIYRGTSNNEQHRHSCHTNTRENKTKKTVQVIMIMWNTLAQCVIEAGALWSMRKQFATYFKKQYAELYSAACFWSVTVLRIKLFYNVGFQLVNCLHFPWILKCRLTSVMTLLSFTRVLMCWVILGCHHVTCCCEVYGSTVILVSHLRLCEIFSISPSAKDISEMLSNIYVTYFK